MEKESPDGKINASEFSSLYPITVISKLFLGHPGPFEVYREINNANDYVNKYTLKKRLFLPLSGEEKKRYENALIVLRKAIEMAFSTGEKPRLGSFVDILREDEQMEDKRIRTTLFLMYFGGAETTAALLNYLLWQLGRHPEYQEEIFEEIQEKGKNFSLFELAHQLESVGKLYSESIRLFSPAFIVSRQPADDLVCSIKDQAGKEIFSDYIYKNEILNTGPTFAARDPKQFENPDEFNPHRFESVPKSFSWLPFGDGTHSCPGQWLAKAEILVFVTALVQRYRFSSSPEKEIPQKGYNPQARGRGLAHPFQA